MPLTRSQFLKKVNAFRKKHEMGPNAYGLLAMNDAAFLHRVEKKPDWQLRETTIAKNLKFMEDYKPNPRNCPTCGQRWPMSRQVHPHTKG